MRPPDNDNMKSRHSTIVELESFLGSFGRVLARGSPTLTRRLHETTATGSDETKHILVDYTGLLHAASNTTVTRYVPESTATGVSRR